MLTACWCEHAWLDDGPVAGVRVVVDGGPDHRRRARRRRRRPGDQRLPGVVLPGLRQRALARLPPGAARPHPRPRRHVLDLARADVRRRRPAGPGQLPRAGPGDLRRDGAGRGHLRRRVPLPAPRARRRAATPTRTRWREALVAGGGRRRHPAHPARRLLPRRRARGHRAPAARRRPARGSPTATPTRWAARVAALRRAAGPADRRGGALRAGGAGRAAGRRRRGPPPAGRCTCTCPSSPPRTRPALAVLRLHARPRLLADRGVLGPGHHRGARHPPDRRRRSPPSARSGTAVCACPSTEADLADGVGPVPLAARRRLAALPRQRPARGDRPARRGPAARGCTSGWSPASAAASGRPSWSTRSPSPATARWAGRTPAGSPPGSGPTWSPSALDTPAHRRLRARPAGRWPPRAADVHTVVVDGRVVVARRAARARRRRRGCWPRRSHRCGRTHEHRWSPASPSWSPTTRRTATARWAGHRRRAGRRRRRRRLGRAGRAARPPPTRRIDVGGRAVIPGFVDSHAHLVFAGDRAARVRGADGRDAATTAAASPRPWRPPGRASDDELRAPAARRWSPRCAPRAPPPSRSRAATGSPSTTRPARLRLAARGDRRRPRSSARTWCPPGTPAGARLRRPGHRPDARRLRAARPVDRRLLRAGLGARVRRRRGARGAGGRPRGRAWACGCTPTSSRPGPACSWRSSSAPPAPTTAPT